MRNNRAEFSVAEQMLVITIILCLVAVVIGSILRAVKKSEERTVQDAVVEYSALRTAYAEMYRVPSQPALPHASPGR